MKEKGDCRLSDETKMKEREKQENAGGEEEGGGEFINNI
jgi:hypothetical protein